MRQFTLITTPQRTSRLKWSGRRSLFYANIAVKARSQVLAKFGVFGKRDSHLLFATDNSFRRHLLFGLSETTLQWL
jgi:hypothetical protein